MLDQFESRFRNASEQLRKPLANIGNQIKRGHERFISASKEATEIAVHSAIMGVSGAIGGYIGTETIIFGLLWPGDALRSAIRQVPMQLPPTNDLLTAGLWVGIPIAIAAGIYEGVKQVRDPYAKYERAFTFNKKPLAVS